MLTKAKSDLHAKVLQRVGADKVVFPERDMGARTAYNLVSTNILDYIELSPDYSLVEISVPPQWVGKNMRELNLRARYGKTCVLRGRACFDPALGLVQREEHAFLRK